MTITAERLLRNVYTGASRLYNPKALRTHILRLLGPKTILYKAFGPF